MEQQKEQSLIVKIVENLYINKSSKWILELDDSDIQPFVIQNWLIMNDSIRILVRWLDKYVFKLPPKMYLSLAWSIIPKSTKMPFVMFIKKKTEEEEYDFILTKVRKHLELSDNDFNSCKHRLIKMIKDDMITWFTFYGIGRKYWKQYYLDFEQMKVIRGKKEQHNNTPVGLEAWGLGG